MNGRRILRRLIGLFLAINGILLILNIKVKREEYFLSPQRLDYIVKVLEKQGIKVNSVLPNDYLPKQEGDLSFPGMSARYTIEKDFFGSHMLHVKHAVGESKVNPSSGQKIQYCSFDQEILAFDGDYIYYENQKISSSREKPTLKEAKRFCEALIKRVKIGEGEHYKVEVEETEKEIFLTYYSVFNEVPVVDSYMTFKVCRKGVISAVFYVGDITVVNTEAKEIYPIDLVLFSLSPFIQEHQGTVIEKVELVYKRRSEEQEIWGQEIIPMYKIVINSLEEPLFVNAYTNERLK